MASEEMVQFWIEIRIRKTEKDIKFWHKSGTVLILTLFNKKFNTNVIDVNDSPIR
jgi:hypothetical protein